MNKEKLSSFIKDELLKDVSEEVLNKFETFENLLLEWNEKFNLTAIKDKEEILEKHFIDSLYLLKYLDIKKHSSFLDVGTGAGFPGIVLAIMKPEVEFTLVESNNKKVSFLNEVRTQLHLNNVFILKGRIEELTALRSNFDYASARAVSQLNILTELIIPYLKVRGIFIAYKGSMVDIEIKQSNRAIHSLDSELIQKETYSLPYSKDGRSLVFIIKKKETKKKYPRPYGEIVSKPL